MKTFALEFPTFEETAGVSISGMQWISLTLGKPPSPPLWSWYLPCQVGTHQEFIKGIYIWGVPCGKDNMEYPPCHLAGAKGCNPPQVSGKCLVDLPGAGQQCFLGTSMSGAQGTGRSDSLGDFQEAMCFDQDLAGQWGNSHSWKFLLHKRYFHKVQIPVI